MESSGLQEGFLEAANAWAELGTVNEGEPGQKKQKSWKGVPGRGNSMDKAQRLATNSPYVGGALKQRGLTGGEMER